MVILILPANALCDQATDKKIRKIIIICSDKCLDVWRTRNMENTENYGYGIWKTRNTTNT